MNKHLKHLMKVVTGFAWIVLVWAANTTCIYCTYQEISLCLSAAIAVPAILLLTESMKTTVRK